MGEETMEDRSGIVFKVLQSKACPTRVVVHRIATKVLQNFKARLIQRNYRWKRAKKDTD
jgi:hypothetical protein